MQSVRDGLIHDATSLFRFVDSIDRFIAEHEGQFTYNDATEGFFGHVHKEVQNTKEFVLGVLAKAGKSGFDELRYRRQLTIHKNNWKIRHTYIKPAADAHTLNIPAPLIRMADNHLQQTPDTRNPEIVVLLTPEPMYFENRPNDIMGDGRIFLEIPYSQASGFFGNLTIFHEIGHYVWNRLLEGQPRSAAFNALIASFEEVFAKNVGLLPTASNRDWIKRTNDFWMQELFCDLFAARHVGPASSFALMDVLSLFGLMQDENDVSFTEHHPAPALRFKEQYKRLQEDGWWECLEDLSAEHLELINSLAGVPESAYKFPLQDRELPPQIVKDFLTVVPLIHNLAVDVTPNAELRSRDFQKWRSLIENCLINGVVPSKLLAENCASPTPVSMINAAYCVYLTKLPQLMGGLEGQCVSKPEHRRKWIERLEDWTMKGIDDYFLLIGIGLNPQV